jgi:hypothetical protein
MPIQKITSGILDTTSVFSSPTISGNLSLDSTGTTGFNTATANTVRVHTAGVEAIRVDSSGRLGIGTSSPGQKLEINGNVLVAANSNLYFNNASGYSPRLSNSVSNDALSVFTNNTEAMRIDSSGRVTKPLSPAFYAYMNSGGSTLFASNANFVFDTVQYNTGSHYSTSTGRFTAPIAGWYHFSTTVLSQSRSNGDQMEIGLTNQTGGLGALGARQVYQSNYTGYGGYIAATASCTIYLNAGDYMRVTNSCGASIYINSGPWAFFSGHLVG